MGRLKKSWRLLVCLLCMIAVEGYPQDSFQFTLDTTPISYHGGPKQWDTVYGSIQNLMEDSLFVGINQSFSPPWLVRAWIFDRYINAGPLDTNKFVLAPLVTLPLVIYIVPYPSGPDTSSACFTVQSLHNNGESKRNCIPLYISSGVGSVSQETSLFNSSRIYPNPFTSSANILLTEEQSTQQFGVIIFDAAGQDATYQFRITIFGDSLSIERSGAAAGIYYYRLRSRVSPQFASIIGAGKFIVR